MSFPQFDFSTMPEQPDIKRLCPADQDTYNLIIGLGGAGIRALSRTKALINQSIDAGEHVRYLGIDSDEYDFRHISNSESPDLASLDRSELILLASNGPLPLIPDWFNAQLPPVYFGNNGACGIRQYGRLKLFTCFEAVRSAMQSAIQALDNSSGHNSKLRIFIITGLGGGTGSGIFIDVAWLARYTAHLRSNFTEANTEIRGYFLTPDTYRHHNIPQTAELLDRNADAAMRELDYNMNLRELNEEYTISWPGWTITPGSDGLQFMDHVNIVSAADMGPALAPDQNVYARDTIARRVMSFIA